MFDTLSVNESLFISDVYVSLGMSIGLMHTERAVWSIALAVVCHEAVISFSLGLQFVKNSFSTCRTFLYAFVCSLILPSGLAIGICVSEMGSKGDTLDLVNGILQVSILSPPRKKIFILINI